MSQTKKNVTNEKKNKSRTKKK